MMKKLFFIFIFLVGSTSLLLQSALAHATPVNYEPALSAVLSQAPSLVQLDFSEALEDSASSIKVYGPGGQRVDAGSAYGSVTDRYRYSVGVSAAVPGTYTVVWQVAAADDGHFTKGTYTFSVGQASPTVAGTSTNEQFEIVHSSPLVEGATVALELIGSAILLGLMVILRWLIKPLRRYYPEFFSAKLEQGLTTKIKRLVTVAVLAVIAGGLAYLILQARSLASLQATHFASAFEIFALTLAGRYTIYRMLLVIAFAFGFYRWYRVEADKHLYKEELVLWSILLINDLARTRVSHAAASDFHPVISVLINFTHLVFKDIWVGGLLVMMVLWASIFKKLKDLRIASFILTAFSKITSVCLAVAGATGAYVIWLHLKSPANILTTGWGAWFVVLTIFALIMLALSLYHQLVIERYIVGLVTDGQLTKQRKEHITNLAFSFPFEMYMGICVLLVTGAIIITTPPLTQHHEFQRNAIDQGLQIHLNEHPYETGQLLITLTDAKKRSETGVDKLVVTLTNPDKALGPITVHPDQRFAGGYVFPESLLTAPGIWHIDSVAQRASVPDSKASFMLDYPRELDNDRVHFNQRTFDSFAMLNVVVALVAIVSGWLLYRYSDRLQARLTGRSATTPEVSGFGLNMRGAWILPLIIAGAMLHGFTGEHTGHSGLLQSGFQQECQRDGNIWEENVPMRAGLVTSSLALNGCNITKSRYHFIDQREYQYFKSTE